MVIIILAFCLGAMVVSFIMLCRNALIFRIRKEAINLCYKRTIRMIEEDYKNGKLTSDDEPDKYFKKYGQYPSYTEQVLQLTKWSFDSLFPGLKEFCK